MATYWKGGNGQWQVAANWSDGAPTTPASDAIINKAGTYTVTVGSGLEYHVGSVLLNDAGATLSIRGILDIQKILKVSKGTLALAGTISGGTLAAAGGTISFRNGTLNGVTYRGTLDLNSAAATLTVTGGLTLTSSVGGAGALQLGGSGHVTFAGDQTVDGGTITITGGEVDVSGTLTFGSSAVVQYESATNAFGNVASITNAGTFSVAKGAMLVTSGQLTNLGTLTVSGGHFIASGLSNSGTATLTVGAGSLFKVSDFVNSGTLTANMATIDLNAGNGPLGNLKVAHSQIDIAGVESASTANSLSRMLAGHHNQFTLGLAIDNTGQTIRLRAPSGFDAFTCDGTITGGTVTIDAPFSGQLTNLTVKGSLNTITGASIQHVTFEGADGSGPGSINLAGTLRQGYGDGQLALDNVTVSAKAGSTLLGDDYLTLGSGFSLQALGAFTFNNGPAEDRLCGLINNGILEADGGSGSTFVLESYYITNNGTIRVENGGT